ncbi:MAG: type II secretion system major pseudopilin GspG [Candidatus Ratteibacteria bacterium]|jgi:general secretion pathway protein G
MRKKGFIGIKMLIIVSILNVLGTINVPSFLDRGSKEKTVLAKTAIDTYLKTGLDLYELDNGSYPSNDQGPSSLAKRPAVAPVPVDWRGPYVYNEELTRDPWGKPYTYVFPGKHNPKSYDLSSNGPDGQPGNNDDITNWKTEAGK